MVVESHTYVHTSVNATRGRVWVLHFLLRVCTTVGLHFRPGYTFSNAHVCVGLCVHVDLLTYGYAITLIYWQILL